MEQPSVCVAVLVHGQKAVTAAQLHINMLALLQLGVGAESS